MRPHHCSKPIEPRLNRSKTVEENNLIVNARALKIRLYAQYQGAAGSLPIVAYLTASKASLGVKSTEVHGSLAAFWIGWN